MKRKKEKGEKERIHLMFIKRKGEEDQANHLRATGKRKKKEKTETVQEVAIKRKITATREDIAQDQEALQVTAAQATPVQAVLTVPKTIERGEYTRESTKKIQEISTESTEGQIPATALND